MCLDGWLKLKWFNMLGKYFGTFTCPLYIKPYHADTDLFTMSDKGKHCDGL